MLSDGVVHPDPVSLVPKMCADCPHHLESGIERPHAVVGGDQEVLNPEVSADIADAGGDSDHGRVVRHSTCHMGSGDARTSPNGGGDLAAAWAVVPGSCARQYTHQHASRRARDRWQMLPQSMPLSLRQLYHG
jgi:hypothetical protein